MKRTREEEVKFLLKDVTHSQEIFRILCSRGSPPVITLEKNQLFDTPQGTLRSRGWTLRLRSALAFDAAKNLWDGMRFTLTIKKPTHRRDTRWEEEMDLGETPGDVQGVVALMKQLGFRQVFFYEKLRSDFRLGAVLVTIAQVPLLGYWLEIEGKGKMIRACARMLGFKKCDEITSDFRTLWEEVEKANNLPVLKKLTFSRKRRSG